MVRTRPVPVFGTSVSLTSGMNAYFRWNQANLGGSMRIAVYAFDDITMFHLAAPLMVFGEVGRLGLASDWQTRLWSDREGTIHTIEGYPIGEVAGPDTVEWADIIVFPSWPQSLV